MSALLARSEQFVLVRRLAQIGLEIGAPAARGDLAAV